MGGIYDSAVSKEKQSLSQSASGYYQKNKKLVSRVLLFAIAHSFSLFQIQAFGWFAAYVLALKGAQMALEHQ